MSNVNLMLGNCLDTLATLSDNSIDSICTDPPYGLNFMGKIWDYQVPSVEIWKECLRVLKPGGHLLAFGGTRTYHRLVVAIEDAGFEIRDQIQWLYGQGFPKSMDISKAIDKEFECQLSLNVNLAELKLKHTLLELRAEKTGSVLGHVAIPQEGAPGKLMVIGEVVGSNGQTVTFQCESEEETSLNTDTLWSSTSEDPSNPGKKFITETKLSQITGSKILNLLPKLSMRVTTCGTGTALKPANEPICLARKPLSEKTVAKNVLKYGTGGLNIDASRIETTEKWAAQGELTGGKSVHDYGDGLNNSGRSESHPAGRFPANVIFDESAAAVLDEQSGFLAGRGNVNDSIQKDHGMFGNGIVRNSKGLGKTEGGGASRFFYVAKASKSDRGAGNIHPTVKPTKLMEYLVKLVTPEGGTVLDPFMGSGTTGVAAKNLGFAFVGCELSPDYFEIARARIEQ